MDILKKLQNLEDIASNPNLRGGIWVSFRLFVYVSDELLENKELLEQPLVKNHSNKDLIQELESIRKRFENEFGFRLEYDKKFETLKKSKSESHKFKAKICDFLQSYRHHFF